MGISKKSTIGNNKSVAIIKFIVFSILGLFLFFVPFSLGEKKSIFVDHAVSLVIALLGPTVPYICVAMMFVGALLPYVKKTWNSSWTEIFFSVSKGVGFFIGCMYLFKIGPEFLFAEKMIPFLFTKLGITLSFAIPIGGMLIVFLTDYGLMEFTGVFARTVMRPIFKTPGRSAIDAVASFVGSYSIALIITGNQYKAGHYNKKEAAIIATGFSTVSATFCVIVARTLDLMDYWNIFFWSTLIITFAVTAITANIWPLKKFPTDCADGVTYIPEEKPKNGFIRTAMEEAIAVSGKSTSVFKNLWKNLLNGFIIVMGITPSLMSIGLLGLLLAEYTPVFDILGVLFYPITYLLGFNEPQVVAKAVSMSIAEMFLPAALVTKSDIITRYVIGVTSISEILFFSASIPCIISSGIPISIKNILIVWFQRVVLTIIIATPVAWLLF